MCGLAGVLDWRSPGDSGLVRTLIERLSHRGPDGIKTCDLGPLQLGHARLSILDTSGRADQPMTSGDGRYTAVHNGEIYNFLELADVLRGLGHAFRTTSDTEVILAAYAEWGEACVERFNGIWAFAIWDGKARRLFVSRDRLGVKPLFLARDGHRLAFASEIKALLCLPWVAAKPQVSAVRDFLLDARVDHGRETFFAGIKRLPAGHNLLVDEEGTTERRFWAPPDLSNDASTVEKPTDGHLIAEVRRAVIESVSLQLRSDVPIGSCLSGGLDSSTIVAVASALRDGRIASSSAEHRERDQAAQLAFFADFAEPAISERRYVDVVVAATGVGLHAVRPSSKDALASLEGIVKAQDEPFGSTSIVAQYHVMRLVREIGVPVLLDGQGADELLGGYMPYRSHRDAPLLLTPRGPGMIAQHVRRGSLGRLARTGWSLATHGGPAPTVLRASRHLRPLLGESIAIAEPIDPVWTLRSGTNLATALWRDVAWGSLPGLLRYEDRNSMAFGIEARVPFLDHRLVELALALPDRLRLNDDIHKVALRRAFPDLVPRQILERRDKIGFASPEDTWLNAWKPELRGLREEPRSEVIGVFKPGALARAFDSWVAGRLARDVFWRVLSVEMWSRVSIFGERLPLP